LNELLEERDFQKFVENLETKTIKENLRNKDNVGNQNNTLRHPKFMR